MGKKIILILAGVIVWSLTMVRSGLNYDFGLGFWGPNGHDGIWHIALANSISKGSTENPVFSGESIKNYHVGFDLILALINKLTNIPITNLYFQILPPVFALIIGLLVYKFVFIWRKSNIEAFWATAFVYFSGSLGFIVTFVKDGIFSGESVFWSQQSVSTLVNPPFALSLIFILAGLISLSKYQESLSTKYYVLCTVFFGLLIQIKAYAAISVLGGLFVAGLFSLFINHKSLIIKVFLGSLLVNLILFMLVKNDNVSIFVWQPFWFLETIMSYSDRLDWQRFYSAMTTYKMGKIYIKEILAYSAAFVIFILGNMGLRIVGFVYYVDLFRKKIKLDETIVFISTILSIGVLIPMFFVQNGTPWNTIQFFYYYLFFFSILAGISIGRFKYLKCVFIIFAIFASWSTLQHYLPKMPQSMISKNELEALTFLKSMPNGVVATYPFGQDKSRSVKYSPRPLYLYESTSYVSALTGKEIFLEDQVNLNIMGYDWKKRRDQIFEFVTTEDIKVGNSFFETNNIRYLYLVREISPVAGEYFKLSPSELGLVEIFKNKDYIIYEYGKDFGNN